MTTKELIAFGDRVLEAGDHLAMELGDAPGIDVMRSLDLDKWRKARDEYQLIRNKLEAIA